MADETKPAENQQTVVYQSGLTTNQDLHPVKLSNIKQLGFYGPSELEYLESVFYALIDAREKTEANRILKLHRNQKVILRFQERTAALSITDQTLETYDGQPSDEAVKGKQSTYLFFVDFVAILIGIATKLQEYYPTAYLTEYHSEYDPALKLREWGSTGDEALISQDKLQYEVIEIEKLIENIQLAFAAWETSGNKAVIAENNPSTIPSDTSTAKVAPIAGDSSSDSQDEESEPEVADEDDDWVDLRDSKTRLELQKQKEFVFYFAKVNLVDLLFNQSKLQLSAFPPELQAIHEELLSIIRSELDVLVSELSERELIQLVSGFTSGAGSLVGREKLYYKLLNRLFAHAENGFLLRYQELFEGNIDFLIQSQLTEDAERTIAVVNNYILTVTKNPELSPAHAKLSTWAKQLSQKFGPLQQDADQQVKSEQPQQQPSSEVQTDQVAGEPAELTAAEFVTPPIMPTAADMQRVMGAYTAAGAAGQALSTNEQAVLPKQVGHVIWGTMAQLFPEESLRNNTIPPQLFEQVNTATIEYLSNLSPQELHKLSKSPSSLIRHIKNLSLRMQATPGYQAYRVANTIPIINRVERIEVETAWALENANYEFFTSHNIDASLVTTDSVLEKEYLEAEQLLEAKIYAYFLQLSNQELLELYTDPAKRAQVFEQITKSLNADPAFKRELSQFYGEVLIYYQKKGLTSEQQGLETTLKNTSHYKISYDEGQIRFILEDIKHVDAQSLFIDQLRTELKDDSPVVLKKTSDILDSLLLTFGPEGTTNMVEKLDTRLLGLMFDLPTNEVNSQNHQTVREILINYARVRASNLAPADGAITTGFLPAPKEIPTDIASLAKHVSPVGDMAKTISEEGTEQTASALNGRKLRAKIDTLKLVANSGWAPLTVEQRAAFYIYADIPFDVSLRNRLQSKNTDPLIDKNLLPVQVQFLGFTGDIDELTIAADRGNYKILDFGKQRELTASQPTPTSKFYEQAVAAKRLENRIALANFLAFTQAEKTQIAAQMAVEVAELENILIQAAAAADEAMVLDAPATEALNNSVIQAGLAEPAFQTEQFVEEDPNVSGSSRANTAIPSSNRVDALKQMASGAVKNKILSSITSTGAASAAASLGVAAASGPVGWTVKALEVLKFAAQNRQLRQILIIGGSTAASMAASVFLYAFGNAAGLITMAASFMLGGPLGLLMGMPLALGASAVMPWANWLPTRVPPNPFGFTGSENPASGYSSMSDMRAANAQATSPTNSAAAQQAAEGQAEAAATDAATSPPPQTAPTAAQSTTTGGTPSNNASSGGSSVFSSPASTTATASTGFGLLSTAAIGLVAPLFALAPIFILTILTIVVIAGSFLVPLPTKPATGQSYTAAGQQATSKYVTVTKTADKGAVPNEIRNNTATDITYTIVITPKPGYSLKITEATDQFSSFGDATTQLQSTFDITQIPLDPLQAASAPMVYTVSIGNGFQNAFITNTFTVTFDVMDASGNVLESNQTFNASASVMVGEPKIGCWPTTGVVTTRPFHVGIPTHAKTDAWDIGAPIGTPIYAPFPGSRLGHHRVWKLDGFGVSNTRRCD